MCLLSSRRASHIGRPVPFSCVNGFLADETCHLARTHAPAHRTRRGDASRRIARTTESIVALEHVDARDPRDPHDALEGPGVASSQCKESKRSGAECSVAASENDAGG